MIKELKVEDIPSTSVDRREARSAIQEIQNAFCTLPGALFGDSQEYLAVCPIHHEFADGAYVRSIFLPKDMFFVTKIHKKTHPYFILAGDVSILTEEGIVRLKGPYQGITKAGTKRVIYTHEDTIWTTVHVTAETDLSKIEEEVIAKDFDELYNVIEIKDFVETIKERTEVEKCHGDL